MKVSSRVDYALSCLIHLAENYNTLHPVSVKYIAEKEELEDDYVEQLLIILKRAGIVLSKRGVTGGYFLADAPDKVTTLEVIRAFDGEVLELVCFRKKGRRKTCIHLKNCEVRTFWTGLSDCISKYLSNQTLACLLELRKKEAGGKNDK